MNIFENSKKLKSFLKDIYGAEDVLLHRPIFFGNEKQYLSECIESNFVSSVGARVIEFETNIANFVGASNGIATVNGTLALHAALLVCGVKRGDEVISQALTFVATSNAITYTGATPVFVDVDIDTLGMSPTALRSWLKKNTHRRSGETYNKTSGARISACVPMHTFGLPCRIKEIADICKEYNLVLIEDSAESLGSYVDNLHTGSFGACSIFSFNGNKIITTGGGGMIVTNNKIIAQKAKHLTTTSKIGHAYEYFHDEVGYNYRLPNLNAALGVAQMENIYQILKSKRKIASKYRKFCSQNDLNFIEPIENTTSNFWLNAILLENLEERDCFLKETNSLGIMTRPIWRLMTELPMYLDCQNDGLQNAKWLVDRVVNVPSSVPEADIRTK